MTDHPVLYVDCETTGLDPQMHPIWEVAAIEADGTEHLWQVKWPRAVLDQAEPIALEINGFEARYDKGACPILTPRESAELFASLSQGLHLVGAVISFDEERLRHMHDINLGRPEGKYPWHYRLICVESMLLGWLGGTVEHPYSPRELAERVGVPTDVETHHTALADARWAKAVYEALTNG